MRRKFLGNLFFLILANLLVKPIWILGIDRYVQNEAGPSLYGAYFAVFNFSFLFHIVLDAGINNFNNREASRDNAFISSHLSTMLNIKFIFSLLYLLITFALAFFTSFDASQYQMLACLALNLILLNFILYFRSNIAAMQYFRIDSILSILDRLLAIIFCAILIFVKPWGYQLDIMHFIYAQSVALALTLVVVMYISYRKAAAFQYSFSKTAILQMLKKSYPFAIIGILMTLYYRLDGVMIEQMLPIDGKEQAGIYAASYRLFDASNMIAYLFATLLLPMFSNMLARQEKVEELTKMAARLLFGTSTCIAVFCYFNASQLMPLLYHSADQSWASIFQLLMISFVAVAMTYVYGTLLTAGGNLKLFNYLAFAGLILNFSLNLYLIPHHKALGATWATFITQFFIMTMQIFFVHSKYQFQFVFKQSAKLLTYLVGIIAISWLCLHFSLSWIWSLGLLACVALGLFLALSIIPLKEFFDLIKQEKAA